MGEGVHAPERYSERLEVLLNESSDELRFEVINTGIDGYTSYQGRTQLERDLIPCEPDMVTVLFGINDRDWEQNIRDVDRAELFDNDLVTLSEWAGRSMLVYFARNSAAQLKGWLFGKTARVPTLETPAEGRTRRVPLQDYRTNLSHIADLGTQHGFVPVFIIVPNSPYSYYPELYDDGLEGLPGGVHTELSWARGLYKQRDYTRAITVLEELLADHPQLSSARNLLATSYQQLQRWEDAHREFVTTNRQIVFTQYEQVVRSVAAEKNVRLVDLVEEFRELRRETLYVDDMHPNSLGQAIIARGIQDQITPLP